MTDDNSKPVDMDDLDAFSAEFLGTEKKAESVDENEDNSLAPDKATDADESDDNSDDDQKPDDTPVEDDEPEVQEEEKPEEEAVKSKKNRKSFQNRIDELVADKRETQRSLEAALKRLEALEARSTEVKNEVPTLREQLPPEAPDPDAADKDGKPIYPMGEFDPQYIKDITKFTIEQELKTAKEREHQEAQMRKLAEERTSIQEDWNKRVDAAEETLPDLRDHMNDLVGTFQNIEPAYGEFLATTIMQCDNGPEIMYYLSQNIGEAQNIVASGALAATLAIGKLDAKFVKPVEAEEQKSNTKQMSQAPKPPVDQVRGRGGQFTVRGDTDDLDTFEREFFKKR